VRHRLTSYAQFCLSLSAERAVRPSRPSCPPSGVLPSGGQIERIDRIAPPSALASRPLARASHLAETIGEDSAWRLVVKAKHCVWRSAPLLCAPRQP
jgi:hypothetical protein